MSTDIVPYEDPELSLYDENKNDSQPLHAKKQVAELHLSDAIHTVFKIMRISQSEKRRFDAAVWLAEMVMGKPKDAVSEEHEKTDGEIALTLAKTLRDLANKNSGNDEASN